MPEARRDGAVGLDNLAARGRRCCQSALDGEYVPVISFLFMLLIGSLNLIEIVIVSSTLFL